MLTYQEKLELIREALKDLIDGVFGEITFAIIVGSIVDPQVVKDEDLAWGKSRMFAIRNQPASARAGE